MSSPAQVSTDGTGFFESRIRPVLVERCYECHSAAAKKVKGGLLLDTRAGVLKGGDNGPILVPGQPESSRLIEAVRYHDHDLRMPPKEPLTAQQIRDFEEWVRIGAPDPRTNTTAVAAAPNVAIDFAAAKTFRAYRPIEDPKPPQVKQAALVKSAVDQFWLAKLEAKGITPAPPADQGTLIRRATYGLTGLPPAPEEIEAFLADKSPDAFAKVVDRLLASRQYGEHWGRHWLDLVRYADTSGCNSDYPVPTAYKYRNYVIDSFNVDKPYDQFVREQIAGDLLPGRTEEEKFEAIVATGYLAISRRFGSRASEFHLTIEDTIDNVGKTFLGLSVSCARCHDHKFDPIPASDYYALYGIFNSTRYAFPGTEIYKHPKDFVPLTTGTNAEAYYRDAAELAELDDKIEKLLEIKRNFERQEKAAVAQVDAALVESTPRQTNQPAAPPKRVVVERKDAVKLPEFRNVIEVKAALEDARTEQRQLENKVYPFEKAYAVRDGVVANARIQKKGEPNNLGDEVPRGFLQVLGGEKVPASHGQSGRKELADWLTAARNPLTARVMVNRIWQYHFGKGLVQSPNDFGVRGQAPTHPELLDFLASRFIESDWSMKKMHRLLMLSSVYQMSTAESAIPASRKPAAHLAAARKADPNNDSLWHFNRRRLSAEEIRDSMLAIAGTLDRSMGGPHPFPAENTWRFTQHKPFVADYDGGARRSVYMMQQRIKRNPFFEVFDGADPNVPTAERAVSTTPLQALFMMNNEFVHQQADEFAVRIGLAFTELSKRIDYAHQLAYGRPATKEDNRVAEEYLASIEQALAETDIPRDRRPRAALASYARVLLSANEFIYVE